MRRLQSACVAAAGTAILVTLLAPLRSVRADNLIADPSFELVKPRDQFGLVFAKWSGWRWEGDCSFEVGEVAHSGKTSGMLACATAGKIRIAQTQDLQPGRYRITAYIRGLDIGTGQWDQTTEFMFNDKYINLRKNGTFGWSRLTYVGELAKAAKTGPSFGLFGPGYLWIDDVSMERVGTDVALTESPKLDREEAPVAPPGPLGAGAVRCPRCRYRNMPEWKKCYACGEALESAKKAPAGPDVKPITSFEQGSPFERGTVVAAHATDGTKALRIDKSYVIMQAPQNWDGYDYLKVDTFVDQAEPLRVWVEIHDTATDGYWTRVNYETIAPPGASTLVLPLHQLFVGEKSRPGRPLLLGGITRLVFGIGDGGPLFLDNLRLERDTDARKVFFDGLHAFDFGTGNSPVMDGFTPITPATLYSKGRGYGLKDAKIWRAFDVLQPDPLYQDFLCIESGGLAVDVPNGKYRVFLNIDNPSGFWGEYQIYHERTVLAQGKTVVSERMDLKAFLKKYFRFWDTEDLPSENTFDKYQRAYFSEKVFDVEVKNGQIYLEFEGANWAMSVSAAIIFPVEKAAQGARFLEWVREKRRFYFDNAFKRVLHTPTGDPLRPGAEDAARGYTVFHRDLMKDVYYNDTPAKGEIAAALGADGFGGQIVPVTVSVLPLQDLGTGHVTVSSLAGPQGAIPAEAIDVGYVSYRVTRVTNSGTVYTLAPRWIIPANSTAMPKGVARRFWISVHVPAGAAPGVYTGRVDFSATAGRASFLPLRLTVRKGRLAPMDIPVGPFGGTIGIPWFEDDPGTLTFDADMNEKGLEALRAYGFTMFTGVPWVPYKGFQNGKPVLDFSAADRQMADARKYGFRAVNSYQAGVIGLDMYHRDMEKMKQAGFTDYASFLRALFSAIDVHARDKEWLPVYWNVGDEPVGDALKDAVQTSAAYRQAVPKGPPFFTAATSLYKADVNDPNFQFARNLHLPMLSGYDEAGIRLLESSGGEWAYYNGGSRWTFGEYLYKAATEFDAKFRLAWHWHAVAGDPYYALDCREDDYAWANATPDRRLVFSVDFMRIAAGVDDYRYLLTLARLAKSRPREPAAQQAAALIARRMASFHLGDTDHDRVFGAGDWAAFRGEVADAIERLK
jgi:hypothetical protein